jgi:hypothetical protein
MVLFVEELAKQHLWEWLEAEKGWEVDGEVRTANGRIDLAARTPDGEYIGIELKAAVNLEFGSTLSEQIQRYIDSGQFDEVYFAGPSVEGVEEALSGNENNPSIPVVREACKCLNAGVAAGKYEKQEVLNRISENVSDEILTYQYAHDDRDIRNYIERRMDYDTTKGSSPITIEEGVRQINNAVVPEAIGVIEVPLPIQGGYLRSPRMALTPGETHDPEIIVEPDTVERSGTPEFDRTGEPWIRHCAWREFGGIPEGHIPNVMESETTDRPIDILAYDSEWDPSKIVAGDEKGEVIGIEAKGASGVTSNRTQTQLREFLETGVLSQLYLAVPRSEREPAIGVLENDSVLDTSVGLLTVDEGGMVEIIREAADLELQYDGYKQKGDMYKTGYGELTIPNGKDVQSPFDLSEWRDPLFDDEDQPVVWEDNPLDFVRTVNERDELDLSNPNEVREELKQYCVQDRVRAYLLRGLSAAPYAKGKPDDRAPKKGYTRLTLTEFETDDGEYGLDLHFGSGSWEGGYVCLVGEQVDDLVTVLASIDNIEEATITGQGRVIDLSEFQFGYGQNYEYKLSGEQARPEQLLPLQVRSVETDDGIGARLQLCEDSKCGVDLVMTEIQRLDFLRTIRIARFGRPSEIPGDSGYERIGPEGDDTWDKRRSIEERHQSDLSVF